MYYCVNLGAPGPLCVQWIFMFHLKQDILPCPLEQIVSSEEHRWSRPTWQHGLSCEDAR